MRWGKSSRNRNPLFLLTVSTSYSTLYSHMRGAPTAFGAFRPNLFLLHSIHADKFDASEDKHNAELDVNDQHDLYCPQKGKLMSARWMLVYMHAATSRQQLMRSIQIGFVVVQDGTRSRVEKRRKGFGEDEAKQARKSSEKWQACMGITLLHFLRPA